MQHVNLRVDACLPRIRKAVCRFLTDLDQPCERREKQDGDILDSLPVEAHARATGVALDEFVERAGLQGLDKICEVVAESNGGNAASQQFRERLPLRVADKAALSGPVEVLDPRLAGRHTNQLDRASILEELDVMADPLQGLVELFRQLARTRDFFIERGQDVDPDRFEENLRKLPY